MDRKYRLLAEALGRAEVNVHQVRVIVAALDRLPDELPAETVKLAEKHGGDATRVLVTIPMKTLTDGLGVATTDTGSTLSPGQARRLACTAGLLPAVLGGKSEVLDLGRSRRLFTPAQRKALMVKQRECAADGCTIPAPWTEAHHQTPWHHGGRTDLDNAVLLCTYHHHRAHDPTYATIKTPAGAWQFHRRT